eukprot:gene1397-32766_t
MQSWVEPSFKVALGGSCVQQIPTTTDYIFGSVGAWLLLNMQLARIPTALYGCTYRARRSAPLQLSPRTTPIIRLAPQASSADASTEVEGAPAAPVAVESIMPLQLSWPSRSHACGVSRASNVGDKMVLCGWVDKNRDLGGLQFFDLRDHTGITQVGQLSNQEGV